MMDAFNYALFSVLNAPSHPHALPLKLALLFAEYTIWVVPAYLVLAWTRGDPGCRPHLVECTVAAVTALGLAQITGLLWPHPRPFMIGMGHTLLSHVADASFPSDHLTLLWSVAGSLLLHRAVRRVGLGLAVMGVPMAWARIYLGIHFPLDMVGAAGIAVLATAAAHIGARWFLTPAVQWAGQCYGRLFQPLIRRGWLQP